MQHCIATTYIIQYSISFMTMKPCFNLTKHRTKDSNCDETLKLDTKDKYKGAY